MMTTSVKDVNSLFTTTGTVDKASSSENKTSDGLSFAQFMNNSAEKSVTETQQNDSTKQSKTVVENTGRKDLKNEATNTEDKVEGINNEEVTETVTKVAEKVKDAIKEKFEISEEELTQVMEELGVTVLDLLNPDTLKDVIVEVTDSAGPMELLTNENLYQDMMDIVNLASDLKEEIKTEFAISDDQLNSIIEQTKSMDVQPESKKEVEEDTKAPDIRVEVTRSDDTRVSNPIETTVPVRSKDNTSDSSEESTEQNDGSKQMMPAQTLQTVETHQVGDVIETVRQFSSIVDGEEIVSQVRDSIKVNISPEETSMELQLHPASLGTVNMNIQSQNGVITAQLLVQNEAVREVLASQIAQLQETLEEQGTKVEAVEVAVAGYDLDRGPFQDRDDRQERQNADGRRKRVNLNLNELDADDISNLDDEDQLARHVMEMNGTSIDFSA